jgi:Raf kinase inhibitor-like YbhB/YbcL family protein
MALAADATHFPDELRAMPLTIESPAFAHGQPIPRAHTCDGDDRSPALRWSGVPEGARSLALIVQDPDAPDPAAPKRIFTHWVLHDIPPSSEGVPDDVSRDDLPRGTREGVQDGGGTGWTGPCPPIGRHRYFFRLFALDITLGDLGTPSRAQLEAAMQGHVLGSAELMGTYERG